MRVFLTALIATMILAVGQASSTQPLVIVVRDGQGDPLAGVSLTLLAAGPPDEPFDTCTTGSDGQCRLLVPPGAYIIRFDGGWQGQTFIPASQQNGSTISDDGASGGGFGIYIDSGLPGERGPTEQIVTFVVGRKAGRLVPLWDMSRSPIAPPQPYAPSVNPFDTTSSLLASVDLGPLTTGGATPEGTAQVAQSQISPGEASTLPTPMSKSAAVDSRIPIASIWLGVIALVIALTIAVVVFLLTRTRRKERP